MAREAGYTRGALYHLFNSKDVLVLARAVDARRGRTRPLARLGGPFVWRAVVGLRLAPRVAPGHVAGWRIGARGAGWLRLEASSWHLTAHVVVHVADEWVSVALLVRYDRPVAAYLWPPVSVLHRSPCCCARHNACLPATTGRTHEVRPQAR